MEKYDYYSDGISIFRQGIRNGLFVVDTIDTALGWAGAENTDWHNIHSMI